MVFPKTQLTLPTVRKVEIYVNTDRIYFGIAGFLFLLVSTFFFELVSRNSSHSDAYTPIPTDEHTDIKEFKINVYFILFFISGLVSLAFPSTRFLLLLYIILQLVFVAISNLKLEHRISKDSCVVTITSINCLFCMVLVVLHLIST